MGTKKMILYLFIILSLNVLKTYSQNGYTEKIKWECKYCIDYRNIVNSDTCELKDSFKIHGYDSHLYTKSMTIENVCYFFEFVPYGSGECLWYIGIYKQEDNLWRMVARGEVAKPVSYITVDFNASRNSFVFSTLNATYDSSKNKSIIKVEDNIGEISISDL
jgi:hypothetical protein